MRKPEQRLWDQMHRARIEHGKDFWLQRVENGIDAGMPDVRGICSRGSEFWVELKVARRPKRTCTKVLGNKGLRLSQINWHIKQHSMRGRSYILADLDGELFLLPGAMAPKLNDALLGELDRWKLTTSDWRSIFAHLRGV